MTTLKIEAIPKSNTYELIAPLVYITGYLENKIIVPKGFITNFASVPSIAKVYIDDNSFHIRSPAVVHDYLYSAQSKHLGYCRKEADLILRNACIECGMRKSKAGFIYHVLRWFGSGNYEKR